MKKHLLVIGGGVMQLPVFRLARDRNLLTICLDADSLAQGRQEADFFYQADIKNEHQCLKAALDHQKRHRVDGVLTVGTDFSTTVAFLAQNLGLPGIPYEVALNATDKHRMRKCFLEQKVPSQRFLLFKEQLSCIPVLDFPYPVVVKPVDNMGARGVCQVLAPSEVLQAVNRAFAFSCSGQVLIEEFIPGPEFSLDAVVRDGRVYPMGLADRHIFFPPFFIEMGHSFPSSASLEQQKELWQVFSLGIRALGINWGAAKGDIKYHPKKGPMVGEIAARLSGGYMSGWSYPYSSRRSAILWAIENALNLPLSPQDEEQLNPVVERALISIPGSIRSIKVREDPQKIPGVKHVFLSVSPGSLTVMPQNNVEKAGNVIALGARLQEAEEAALKARNAFLFELEVPYSTTEHFFWQSKDLPWWFGQASFLEQQMNVQGLYYQGYDEVFSQDWLEQAQRLGWKDPYGNTPAALFDLLSFFVKKNGSTLRSYPSVFWYFFLKGGVQGALYFKEGYEKKLWPFC